MQIHELTKRNKRTDEGLLDGIKNAVTAAKTGFQTASDAYATNKAVGDQETRNANAAKIARQMAARGYNVDTSDPTVKRNGQTQVAGGTITSVMADNELKQAAKVAAAKFTAATATPELAPIIYDEPASTDTTIDTETPYVEPGYKLTVASVVSGYPTDYYIGSDGAWRNDLGQKLSDQSSITKLNGLANQGQDSGKIKPTRLPADQQVKQKQNKQPKQPTTTQPAKSAKPVAESSSGQSNNIDAALTRAAKTPGVTKAFDKFSKQYQTSPKQVTDRSDVNQAWKQVINAGKSRMQQGKKARIEKAFQNYATVVLAAMKAVGTGEETADSNTLDTSGVPASSASPAQQAQATQKLASVGVDPQTINKVKTAVRRNPSAKPIVKQAIGLDEQLSHELSKLKFLTLYEDSVQITKDIVVKTNLGNYVKKAEDQTWYDPNGVPIDPIKYADYIKKLDATPAAQTRYQADSLAGRGSDTAYTKAKTPQQSAPHNEPVPDFSQQEALARLKQMEDYNQIQAMLQSNNVAGLNSLVTDTFNQLQNAKIFKTGQEDYLRDRMGALMAMKAG